MRAKAILLLSVAILTSIAITQPFLWAADMSKQAVEYRLKGYQAQKSGDIENAVKYYQKAVALNPNYAIAYNDLGVVYEGKGWLDKAEWAYLKALQIDPNYVDVYSNLALLHERKNEIDKAIFYWKKRIQFGDPNNLWTQKAWQKLAKYAPEEIEKLEAEKRKLEEKKRKEEAKRLAEMMAKEEEKKKKQNALLAKKYYRRANSLFKKGAYDKALSQTTEALKLTPDNQEVINLEKKIKIKIDEERIAAHFTQGMKYYQSGDYLNAGEEFKKMLELLPRED